MKLFQAEKVLVRTFFFCLNMRCLYLNRRLRVAGQTRKLFLIFQLIMFEYMGCFCGGVQLENVGVDFLNKTSFWIQAGSYNK